MLLGSNTDVAGLDIRGTGGLFGNPAGISGPGPLNNIVIQQTSITQTGAIAAGISFGAGNSNIRIFDTTVTGAGFLGGIFFGIDNRDIEIARVTVTNTSKGQDGAELASLRGLTIPVRLAGPFDALDWRIEWSSVAAAAVQRRLEDKLGEKLGLKPPADAASAVSPKDALKNTLKGLFK